MHKLKQYINYYKNMKTTSITCGLLGLALAAPAYSQTVVDITGATAFRSAAVAAIRAKFAAGGNYQYAHNGTTNNVGSASRSIFKGTFQGVTGTTVIRCSWNGSVEGIKALVDNTAYPTFYQNVNGNFVTAASAVGGETLTTTAGFANSTEVSQPEFAFSDVNKSSTPFAANAFQPADPEVGVVIFAMLTNEGSTITNVTSQQFRALFSNGSQPLRLFTGVKADTSNVYAVGRNDGSGTRTTYLAETGYGITNPVSQFVGTSNTTDTFTGLQKTAAGGTFKSTVWGQDFDGNGGYTSGGDLTTLFGKTGSNVTVLDADGTTPLQEGGKADLVTWVVLNDANTARNTGAVVCAYNGVKLDDFAAPGNRTFSALSSADKAKVTEGAYTAWGYQQMYARQGTYTGNTKFVYDGIKASIPANIGTAGIPVGDMKAGRPDDGATVQPF
jgi:hypothetical protein